METGNHHIAVNPHIERLLIIYQRGHSHKSVKRAAGELIHHGAETALGEYGIDGGNAETVTLKTGCQFHKAVHGCGGLFYHKVYGQALQQTDGLGVPAVYYNGNLIGPATLHDADQAFYHGNAAYGHQRLGLTESLGCQTATLTCRNDAETHKILRILLLTCVQMLQLVAVVTTVKEELTERIGVYLLLVTA